MLLPEPSAKRVMRRCPACSARVELSALECPICGHEFGTTEPSSPLAPPPAAGARSESDELLQGMASAQFDFQTESNVAHRFAERATRILQRLPWGVLGVVAMVIVLGLGANTLLQNGSVLGSLRPTATPAGKSSATPASAVRAATSTVLPATITPIPIPPTRTPVPPVDYVVKPNDTCASIAEGAKVSTRDIMVLNGLDADCFIIAGNKIKLPPPSPTPGPTPTLDARAPIATSTRPPQLAYEVKDGDVCGIIADRFGISVDQIISQNKLDEDCTIRLGQSLVLNFAASSGDSAAGPTAQPRVAVLPTPRTGYSAPLMISPADRATYSSTQDALTLQWLTVGLLKDNEWYVVQIQPEGTELVPIFETKATSLKVTSNLLGGQNDRKFTWWVQVKRLLSSGADGGNRVYENLSPPSEPRLFRWTLS